MPITEAQREAYHRRHHVWTHREVKQEEVESMVRFGRKWLWDMTMNVPLLMLEDALDVPWSATGFDVDGMEVRLAVAAAKLMGVEPRRVRCEMLHTKFAPADPQFLLAAGDDPMPPISVQLVLWSQWTKEAATTKKRASWIPPPPPRSEPRPARNYLITASYEALIEATDHYRLNFTRSEGAHAGDNANRADRPHNLHHDLDGRVPAHSRDARLTVHR